MTNLLVVNFNFSLLLLGVYLSRALLAAMAAAVFSRVLLPAGFTELVYLATLAAGAIAWRWGS